MKFQTPTRLTRHISGVRRNFWKYFDSWLLPLDSPIALKLNALHHKLTNRVLGVRKIGV